MQGVVADTHAAVWYLLESSQLSSGALAAMDGAALSGGRIYLSAISLVEVIYLVEKGRIPQAALVRLNAAIDDSLSGFAIVPVDTAVARAIQQLPRDVVPEMPDRIIGATALHLGLPLVTRDHRLQAAGLHTIW